MITNRDLECIGPGISCLCRAEDVPRRAPATGLWEKRAALPKTVGSVRRAVRTWTATAVEDEEIGESIVLAVDEAVTNVVEHAYRTLAGDVLVVAVSRPCGDGVAVVVQDYGAWLPPAVDRGFRGRGLELMSSLADRFALLRSREGTSIRMCWRMGLPDT
jgi:anti-sigma regulatory factor (Ser/Thr protein kinase)